MKTLGSVNKVVLRSLTRSFQHGVEQQYKQQFHASCAKVLSFCRDLCFLLHILQLNVPWKDISTRTFILHIHANSALFDDDQSQEDMESSLLSLPGFQNLCDMLLQYRLRTKKNLFVSLRQVATWNIGGGAVHRLQESNKLKVIRRLGYKGIVCLQETRWTEASTMALQQRLCRQQVFQSPATVNETGHLSGGVAILVPLGYTVHLSRLGTQFIYMLKS